MQGDSTDRWVFGEMSTFKTESPFHNVDHKAECLERHSYTPSNCAPRQPECVQRRTMQ